jgi:hypothetical protein
MRSFLRDTAWIAARYAVVVVALLPWAILYGYLAAGRNLHWIVRGAFLAVGIVTAIPAWRWIDQRIARRDVTVQVDAMVAVAAMPEVFFRFYGGAERRPHVAVAPARNADPRVAPRADDVFVFVLPRQERGTIQAA